MQRLIFSLTHRRCGIPGLIEGIVVEMGSPITALNSMNHGYFPIAVFRDEVEYNFMMEKIVATIYASKGALTPKDFALIRIAPETSVYDIPEVELIKILYKHGSEDENYRTGIKKVDGYTTGD